MGVALVICRQKKSFWFLVSGITNTERWLLSEAETSQSAGFWFLVDPLLNPPTSSALRAPSPGRRKAEFFLFWEDLKGLRHSGLRDYFLFSIFYLFLVSIIQPPIFDIRLSYASNSPAITFIELIVRMASDNMAPFTISG